MARFFSFGRMLLAGAFLASTVLIGACTKAPATGEVSKLDDQRTAAESAEKKLAELRLERIKLEHELQEKQALLQKGKAASQAAVADSAKGSAARTTTMPANAGMAPVVAPTPAASVPGDSASHAAAPAPASPAAANSAAASVVAPAQAVKAPADTTAKPPATAGDTTAKTK